MGNQPSFQEQPSFQQFDYRIRPNKSTERRMFNEAFRRLSSFEAVENYRYIGFGSTTFTDFILFHRALNICDMISIEKREDYRARFDFNQPFNCVRVEYGDSNAVLPKLPWDKRAIVWLDYDGRLKASVLRDVAFISTQARSGSMLIITVNANGRRSYRGSNYKRLEEQWLSDFKEDLELDVLPGDIRGTNLEGDEMAKTCRRFILNEISQILSRRNNLNSPEHMMNYQPLFNFVYRDGARMLTVGGIFYEASEGALLHRCQFDQLEYVSAGNQDFYEIKVPVMTLRERHYLDQRLPKGASHEAVDRLGLTHDEVANYVRLYRYCPSFAEIELS